MKTLSLLVFMLFMLIPVLLVAQEGKIILKKAGKEDFAGNAVDIANRSARYANFALSLDKRSWQKFGLPPNEDRLAYAPDEAIQRMYMRVASGKEYTLEIHSRYSLVWNGARSVWEVKGVKGRK